MHDGLKIILIALGFFAILIGASGEIIPVILIGLILMAIVVLSTLWENRHC